MTKQESLDKAAKEFGYDKIGDVIMEEGELNKVIDRAMQIYSDSNMQELKQELEAWKYDAQINEAFLGAICDLIPDEEKETKLVDGDKEPSILKRIWWNVENALYK